MRPTTTLRLAAAVAMTTGLWCIPAAWADAPATPAQAAAVSVDKVEAVAKAQQVLDRAVAFLKSQQNADGSWGTEQDPPAISALALRAIVREPSYNASTDFVARGFDRLLSDQRMDGGIYRDLLATYNTAIALSTLVEADRVKYHEEIDRATNYLRRLQWTTETRPEYPGKPDEKVPEANTGQQVVLDENDPFYGGWGYGGRSRGAGRPDLSNAHLAIEALHDAGVDTDDPAMQRAIKFLTRTQNYSETNDQPWAGDDGGFVYGPSADRQGESFAGEYTGPDGRRMLRSYGSMTYAGLKSFIYAGLTKEDPRVTAAFGWINANWTLDENPGMALADPASRMHGYYYYLHTLARALRTYGQAELQTPAGTVDWRVALIDRVAQLQQADGSFAGEKRWMENNPVLVTSYVALALQEARESLVGP